ncbi:MAG: ABC transporter permease, partial [Schaalia georgiae]|nr:ABC transporter permease [Schaalia georgiae]
MSEARTMEDIQVKRSWKMPVVYALAAVLLGFFAFTARGDVTLRLNDKSQSLNIPDIVAAGAPILCVLFLFNAVIAAWSAYSTFQRRTNPRALETAMMGVAGVATVLGFLVFAGSGSNGAVTLTSTLVSTVAISTPLIFGALSGVVSEHVGVVNIAIEGDLLVGA